MIVFAGDSITDADKNTTMDRIGNGYVLLMREALAAFSADWLSHVQCDRERRQFTQYSDALGKGHGCKSAFCGVLFDRCQWYWRNINCLESEKPLVSKEEYEYNLTEICMNAERYNRFILCTR